MARIPPIEIDQAAPAVRALYEQLRLTLGIEPNNFFKTLAHQPELLSPMIALTGALLEGGRLPRRLKEWVILHVAFAQGSPYVFDAHLRAIARLVLPAGAGAPLRPDEAETLALRYATEVMKGGASADTFTRLRARFDEAAIVELTLLVGFYGMVCRLVETLETPIDPLRFIVPPAGT